MLLGDPVKERMYTLCSSCPRLFFQVVQKVPLYLNLYCDLSKSLGFRFVMHCTYCQAHCAPFLRCPNRLAIDTVLLALLGLVKNVSYMYMHFKMHY